jgi:hypothetical protein
LTNGHEIIRRAPWSRVPPLFRRITVNSRVYYLLSMWLRSHPPHTTPFTVKQLANEFAVNTMYMFQTLNKYRHHSKLFLKYIPIPSTIRKSTDEWNHAIRRLHDDGFFMISPEKYHSKYWVEPTFRQFEDYNARYFGEGIHRVQYRLEDAVTFSMAIDGIDIKKELAATLTKRAMLESS